MIKIEEGSGNVFADLGLDNPEERLQKAIYEYNHTDIVVHWPGKGIPCTSIFALNRKTQEWLDFVWSLSTDLDWEEYAEAIVNLAAWCGFTIRETHEGDE